MRRGTRRPARIRTAAAWTAAALAAALAPACASGPGPAPAEVTGCYRIERSGAAASLDLPWGFALAEAPLEGWPNVADGRVAHTVSGSGATADHPFGYWAPLPGDSVRVGHPGGAGFDLRLELRGADLHGTARATTDVSGGAPMPPPAPVVALRVPCGEG